MFILCTEKGTRARSHTFGRSFKSFYFIFMNRLPAVNIKSINIYMTNKNFTIHIDNL